MKSLSAREIRAAIDKSGYVLELRLTPQLERAGFHVFVSEQFQDQDTGKSREIDLLGWKPIEIQEHQQQIGERTLVTHDRLDVRLVIECKSTTTPLVFFSSRDHNATGYAMFGGYPKRAWDFDNTSRESRGRPVLVQRFGSPDDPPVIWGEPLDSLLGLEKFHSNWNSAPITSRFAKLISKKQSHTLEWELDHGGIYPSIDKLCRAASYVHLESKRDGLPPQDEANHFHLFMTYPVLVVSGELFECRVSQRNYSVKRADQLFLDWQLEGQNVKGRFRIAVVQQRRLAAYLNQIADDIAGVTAALLHNDKALRTALRIEQEHSDKFDDEIEE
jgi:hypothetical protein